LILSRDRVLYSSLPCPDWLWSHPISYPAGAEASFCGGKVAGA